MLAAGTPIELGVLMDFASAGQGTLYEVRISDTTLSFGGGLLPEPSTRLLLAAGIGMAAPAARRP